MSKIDDKFCALGGFRKGFRTGSTIAEPLRNPPAEERDALRNPCGTLCGTPARFNAEPLRNPRCQVQNEPSEKALAEPFFQNSLEIEENSKKDNESGQKTAKSGENLKKGSANHASYTGPWIKWAADNHEPFIVVGLAGDHYICIKRMGREHENAIEISLTNWENNFVEGDQL